MLPRLIDFALVASVRRAHQGQRRPILRNRAAPPQMSISTTRVPFRTHVYHTEHAVDEPRHRHGRHRQYRAHGLWGTNARRLSEPATLPHARADSNAEELGHGRRADAVTGARWLLDDRNLV